MMIKIQTLLQLSFIRLRFRRSEDQMEISV